MRLLFQPAVSGRTRDAGGFSGSLRRAARRRGGVGVLTLVLVAGCGRYGQPDDDFEEDLVEKGACGDVYFFAHDEDDEILLEVTLPPLLEDLGGFERTYEYELPVTDLEVAVTTGRDVSALACNDVVVDGGPIVEQRWVATEGELTLVIRPGATAGKRPRVTLEMRNVHLEGDLQPLEIESFEFVNLPLALPPG